MKYEIWSTWTSKGGSVELPENVIILKIEKLKTDKTRFEITYLSPCQEGEDANEQKSN